MGKIIDITDKLSFDENPKIKIKGEEFEINSDATAVLKIMGLFSDESKSETESSLAAYEMMFDEKDRKRIEKMKLKFKDLMVVIETAMKAMAGGEDQGEDQTHTTT